MARMVQCIKLGKEAEGLDFPPYPGELGKRIWESVSKEAWAAWLKQQTMLVNENRLNLADAARPPVPGAPDGKALLRRRRRRRAGLRSPAAQLIRGSRDGRAGRLGRRRHAAQRALRRHLSLRKRRRWPRPAMCSWAAAACPRPGPASAQWRILETGFGLGLQLSGNLAGLAGRSAAAAAAALRLDRGLPGRARRPAARPRRRSPSSRRWPRELAAQWWGLLPGFHRLAFEGGRVLLTLCIGDVQAMLRAQHRFEADSIFLDGFSPERNPADVVEPTRSRPWPALRGAARGWRPGPWRGRCAMRWRPAASSCARPRACRPSATACRACSSLRGRCGNAALDPAAVSRAGPLRRGRRGAGRRGRRGQPGAARLAGAGAGGRRPSRGGRFGPAGRRARAACLARRRPALAPHAGGRARHLATGLRRCWPKARTGAPAACSSAAAPTPPACRGLERRGAERVLACVGRTVARGRPARRCGRDLARARRLGAACAAGRGLAGSARHPRRRRDAASRGSKAPARWLLRDAEGELLAEADRVVIAAGHESSALAPAMPLQPVRGQLAWGRMAADMRLPPMPINGDGHLIAHVPDPGGPLWLTGATFDRDNGEASLRSDDTESNRERLARLHPEAARQLAPLFERGELEAWAGVRCASSDRRPLVGPRDAEAPGGIWLCTAMGSRGLSFAALCAELLAARWHGEPKLVHRLAAPARARARAAHAARGALRRAESPRRGLHRVVRDGVARGAVRGRASRAPDARAAAADHARSAGCTSTWSRRAARSRPSRRRTSTSACAAPEER